MTYAFSDHYSSYQSEAQLKYEIDFILLNKLVFLCSPRLEKSSFIIEVLATVSKHRQLRNGGPEKANGESTKKSEKFQLLGRKYCFVC